MNLGLWNNCLPTTRVLAHPVGSTGRKQGPFLKSILAGLHPADLHILLLPSSSCPCDVSGTLGPFVIIKVCSVGYLLLEKVSPPIDTSHDYVQGLCFTFALWVFFFWKIIFILIIKCMNVCLCWDMCIRVQTGAAESCDLQN